MLWKCNAKAIFFFKTVQLKLFNFLIETGASLPSPLIFPLPALASTRSNDSRSFSDQKGGKFSSQDLQKNTSGVLSEIFKF